MILIRCHQQTQRLSADTTLDNLTRRTVKAIVESGTLFFIAQLSYAVLTLLEHPAAQLSFQVAIQVYVRL